jgi:quinoprotein dehydrogenase-associated probable ABC transporter substrate-binding protein
MSSATKSLALLVVASATLAYSSTPALRVCADPNNLPYSNQQQQGFENDLAQMIASDFGTAVSYTWFAQRGAFFRKTLNAGQCDVVMGVPAGMEKLATTLPYYRSTYVFVSRRDKHLDIHSLDDPRLRRLQIGFHVLGDSDRDLPPVEALTSRGIVRNLVGLDIFGNLDEANPASGIIKAVAQGRVDIAVAWGPMAGYFAGQSTVPLRVVPIDPDPSDPSLPMAFDIAIGVRAADGELRQRLDAELNRRKAEIGRLLQSYGIPCVAGEGN